MLVYRVFPYDAAAAEGEPGHPLYLHHGQGQGRWDNPDLYDALYLAASPTGAVGESFAHLAIWSAEMLIAPVARSTVRALGVYAIDEEAHPLLDFDDPRALAERGIRPTDIVKRNRPRSQQLARDVFNERRWSGVSWWSMHRPQWTLHALWQLSDVTIERVEALQGHPALLDASRILARSVDADLR